MLVSAALILLLKWFGKRIGKMNDKEQEEEFKTCDKCNKKVYEDGDIYECEECEEDCCNDCCIQFDNTGYLICKKCIDKLYPREKQIIEKETPDKEEKP